jgi:hypothetical protein
MTSGTMQGLIRVCSQCRHYRQRKPIQAVASRHLSTPGALEAKLAWDNEQRELAALEAQRFAARQDFDFEPVSFPWCDEWTRQSGGETIDPVSGEMRKIYVLCAQGNADGQCKYFEERR